MTYSHDHFTDTLSVQGCPQTSPGQDFHIWWSQHYVPNLDSIVIRSGNAHDSDAKKLT